MSSSSLVKETAERTAVVSFTEINERRRGPIRRFFHRHPRLMDLLVSTFFVVGTLPNAVFGTSGQERWWLIVLVLAAAGCLLFRRFKPVLILFVLSLAEPLITLLSDATMSFGIGIWACLYAVALQHSARYAFTAMALSSIPSIGSFWVAPEEAFSDDPWVILVIIGFVLLTYFIAVGIGVTVRRDRLHEMELADWAERNERLASANERNRIAREMHDVVAHSLSVMIALSDGAGVVVRKNPDRAGEVLTELSSAGRTALADMRRVLGVLREGEGSAAPREPQPVTGSLASLLDGFRLAGLPLKSVVTGRALPEHHGFQLTVYRIVQESLTNVLRYAKGVSTVEVLIEREGSKVRIRVTDDGAGSLDGDSVGSGQGINGIRERAAIYDGRAVIGPLESGWRVDVTLVVPDEGE
ncbi:sensor histidine kinase [Arthrobacter roseus]|uniref:sensor histidine kinase n=1 Tax=Arthrobacter roseus TaxID=136274 RepID=UPI001EF84341|nr:histidine kinase [Arthrobacter roseus]MBM7847102.1 signal transduction histidine kinase [Arthrobacter roseus]